MAYYLFLLPKGLGSKKQHCSLNSWEGCCIVIHAMWKMLKQFGASLQRLRWKLTFSYTAVTVGALLAVELVVMGIALAFFAANPGPTPRQLIQQIETQLVPEVQPYLKATPPDIEGLALLQRPLVGGLVESEIRSTFGNIQLSLATNVNLKIMVIGADGRLLTTIPYDHAQRQHIGQPFNVTTIPGLKTHLKAALAGNRDYSLLYSVQTPANRLVGAIPVASGKTVLGALAFTTDPLPLGTWTFRDMARQLAISLLFFTLFAGAMGTVFGSLTAKGLASRLDLLSEATSSWSQGDFSMYVEDQTGDELAQLTSDLNQMAQRLEHLLTKRQEMSILEERNRLARDLHDSAKQQAFAASAQLGAARALFRQDPAAAAAHLTEAEALVDGVRQELTHLIEELRPVALQGNGLTSALRSYLADWSHQNKIRAEVRAQRERPLPLEIEQTLFRVAQEALANIAWHSHARRAEIWLAYAPKSITVVISDDGRGFDPHQKSAGLGLRSMRERIGLLGGRLDILSAPNQGTQVKIRCPIQDRQKA